MTIEKVERLVWSVGLTIKSARFFCSSFSCAPMAVAMLERLYCYCLLIFPNPEEDYYLV